MAAKNPHDSLFKDTFSQPENANAVFQRHLPKELVAGLDLSSTELMPGSFIDENLKSQQTDLLYRVRYHDSPVLIYLLFEHQSTTDKGMA